MPRDDRHHPVDLRATDRGSDVGSGDEDTTVGLEGDGILACEPAEALSVGEVERALEREPRDRAVHRAGIEVAEAQPLGEAPGNRALPRACGPVDGNDHQLGSFIAWSRTRGGRKSRGSL